MGYTHYFPQDKSFTQEQWSNFCSDANTIIKALQAEGLKLESNSESGLMVNEKAGYISLNGVGDDAHETFHITQTRNSDFNFTKTARKPYDVAVVSLLLLAHHHAPGALSFSSDGRAKDMSKACLFNAEVLGYGYLLPESLRFFEEDTKFIHDECAGVIIKKEKAKLQEQTPHSNISPKKTEHRKI